MKFFSYLWTFFKNVLWALIIIIIYFLLIGMIKTGGAVKYFHFLNARDWSVISQNISILDPETLANIFYEADNISGAMVPEGHILEDSNLTGVLIETGIIEDTGLNVYDPDFQNDFNDSLNEQFSGNLYGSGDFGFVNTGV